MLPYLPLCHFRLAVFAPHARTFGFFLDFNEFRTSALQPYPIGHPSRPSPAVLNAVYLIGIHMSPFTEHEQHVLERALAQSTYNPSTHDVREGLHSIQAEVLLANYFYDVDRLQEGRFHSSAAAALVLALGIHRPTPTNRGQQQTQQSRYDNLKNDALWTVYMLEKWWAIALDTPATTALDEAVANAPIPHLDIVNPPTVHEEIETDWLASQEGSDTDPAPTNWRLSNIRDFISSVPNNQQFTGLQQLVIATWFYERSNTLVRRSGRGWW